MFLLVLLSFIFAAHAHAADGDGAKEVLLQDLYALVTIKSAVSMAGPYLCLFATFSELPTARVEAVAWTPSRDAEGCTSYSASASLPQSPFVVMLRRGTCTFQQKLLRAQEAGALGMLVAGDAEVPLLMGSGNSSDVTRSATFAVGVTRSVGELILNATLAKNASTGSLIIVVEAYHAPYVWTSMGCLILLGTSLVVAGACFSTSDLKYGPVVWQSSSSTSRAVSAPHPEDVVEIDGYATIGFVVFGSCMLVFLFYFMWMAIYFIIFAFCFGGFHCVWQIGSFFLQRISPPLGRQLSIPFLRDDCVELTRSDLLASIPALLVVMAWLIYRNSEIGWVFQDVIGAAFLCTLQRTVRLPDMRVATVLLSAMFCFDIFWVFISPLFFTAPSSGAPSGQHGSQHQHPTSVMIRVAEGGGTGQKIPMLLRMPVIGDQLGNEMMLGFGDIALPGLLITFLLRQDLMSKRSTLNGFFLPAVVGYACGLALTFWMLSVLQMGQPALLYLVPGTLGTTLLLAACRGQLGNLWNVAGSTCLVDSLLADQP